MNITYKFIPHGQSYKIPDNKDEVVLDVGGLNEGLIFDHHFPNGSKDCAAKLVFNNKGRLNELYDKVKEGKIKDVQIVVHNDPDFDCSCAAWFVKNYLTGVDLSSDGVKWVIKYASLVDSGNLKINNEFFLAPSTAMYAFYELAEKKIKNDELNSVDKYKWILDKAFDLLNWCAENLSGINIDNYKNIDNKSIFELMINAHKFDKEYDLLKEDRKKYENELLNKKISETIEDFLVFDQENSIKGVKALIYHQIPQSTLTKYWARNDDYIFTLIPLSCDGQWDYAIWKPANFTGKPNRVIMSVPPDSEYNLQTLAIQLERAECEYERRILGDSSELKRTRTVIRSGYENEKWVINNDPWYDGSSKNYTIVDAPFSLSLLPIEKIIELAKSFTEKDVSDIQIKIIYPIILRVDNKAKEDSWKHFFQENNIGKNNNSNTWIQMKKPTYNNRDPENLYLFDYAKKLLNLDGVTELETKSGTLWYQNNNKFIINISENDGIKKYMVIDSNDLESNTSCYEIFDSRMVCFSSKIAFLILSTEIPGVNSVSDIPGILKGINCNFEKDLKAFFDLKHLDIKDPTYLIFTEFNKKFMYIDIGYDVFSICSFFDDTVPKTDGSKEKNLMEKILFRINAGTVFGFSRNCSVLATIGTQKHKEPQFIKAYKESLNGQWLYEWILVMHQHWKMVDIKTRLGTSKMFHKGTLSKLRSELVEFTSNACFTQVTGDPIGAELYNRWKQLLTLDDLNKEVSTQLMSLDENSRSAFQSKVTFITFLLFPVTTILGVLTFAHLNLGFNLSDNSLEGNLLRLIAIIGICGLISILLMHYANKR